MKALVLIANGSEEIEAVTVVDVLRRANIEVTVAAVNNSDDDSLIVTCSRGVKILADCTIQDVMLADPSNIIILPGGLAAAELFSTHPQVQSLLKEYWEGGRHVAAICASTIALHAAQIAKGRGVTSYPSPTFIDRLSSYYKYDREQGVVVDGKLITSQGPATAMNWALTIVAELIPANARSMLKSQLLFK